MLIEIIITHPHLLQEKIKEFEQTRTIKKITYLLPNPQVMAIIEYSLSQKNKKVIAEQEKKEKADELKQKMSNRRNYL